MAPDSTSPGGGRHSILDLAPLELDCMNALWPSGEATVRQVQEALRPRRPRAYTTIMTILDRLAQKGIVQRRKSGRAWIYQPVVSADQARAHAVSQVVDGFFGGSARALESHLTGHPAGEIEAETKRLAGAPRESPTPPARTRTNRAAANAEVQSKPSPESSAPANLDTALL